MTEEGYLGYVLRKDTKGKQIFIVIHCFSGCGWRQKILSDSCLDSVLNGSLNWEFHVLVMVQQTNLSLTQSMTVSKVESELTSARQRGDSVLVCMEFTLGFQTLCPRIPVPNCFLSPPWHSSLLVYTNASQLTFLFPSISPLFFPSWDFCFCLDLVETPPPPVAPHGLEFTAQLPDPHQFSSQEPGFQAGASTPGHRKLAWSKS